MKVVPVAADSLGVRSMATYVETNECKIFIDPGAALGPSRYGLPPAKEEFAALNQYTEEIHKIAVKCDILVISHYHYDHHNPDETFYNKKTVFAKDIQKDINKSQKERGKYFAAQVKDKCSLIYCDAQDFEIKGVKLKFSPPFYHGPEKTALGFVIMTTVDDGKFKFLHASDVQGPVSKDACRYIIKENPDLVMLDGPPTIFLGWKFSYKNLYQSIENLLRIISESKCKIILDHHLLRDLKYRVLLSAVYEKGNIISSAEYLGKEINMLEAHRKNLWNRSGKK